MRAFRHRRRVTAYWATLQDQVTCGRMDITFTAAAVITGCQAVGLALLAGIRNGFRAGGTTMGVATASTEVTGDK
jgi:hypothetical protein